MKWRLKICKKDMSAWCRVSKVAGLRHSIAWQLTVMINVRELHTKKSVLKGSSNEQWVNLLVPCWIPGSQDFTGAPKYIDPTTG